MTVAAELGSDFPQSPVTSKGALRIDGTPGRNVLGVDVKVLRAGPISRCVWVVAVAYRGGEPRSCTTKLYDRTDDEITPDAVDS